MTRNILSVITAVAVGLLGGLAVGCGGGSGGGGGGGSTAVAATGTGQLEVQLTDAPLKDLTRVKLAQVTVERVEVHVASVGSSSAAAVGSGQGNGNGQGNGQPAGVGQGMTVTPSGNLLPDNAMGGNPNAMGGNPNAGGANAAAVSSNSGGTAAVSSSNAGGNGNGNGGSNNAQGGNWLTIFDAAQAGAPKVYNLLDLRGGITAELAKANLPPGNYTHLKLVVSAAELILDTTSYSTANGLLDLPSGEIQIAFSGKNSIVVQAGQTTQVLLDFDVGRSFNSVGPPSNPTRFTLLPTVRGANLAMSGSLAGAITSDNLTPANTADDMPLNAVTVTATRPGEQVITYSDAQGAYFLAGLDEGAWDVTFSDAAHTDQTITVTITKAQQTTQDVLLVKK